MICVEGISKMVLARLVSMGYEKHNSISCESLVFPNKRQAKGNIKRISEQELRLLFIEEFKKSNSDLLYSIETPTEKKYKFGAALDLIVCDKSGQSALVDMCVLERGVDGCRRILNVEFKHKNSSIKNIGKDVLKLICERQNGAFVQLLKNTNRGTLCNAKRTGVFDKLLDSFLCYKRSWTSRDKYIRVVILSLEENILIYRDICHRDLGNLETIFFSSSRCGKIGNVIGRNSWKTL